jgi:biopolymer transport protein ExbD
MQIARGAHLEANINVTPLVDVCLVLLIIFMVVTPMLVNGTVELPETTNNTPRAEEKQIDITVKSDGSVYLDTLVVRSDEAASALQRMHAEHPERRIAVRGDKRVQYGSVVDVLDACRRAGYEDVSLVSLKRQE